MFNVWIVGIIVMVVTILVGIRVCQILYEWSFNPFINKRIKEGRAKNENQRIDN